MIQARADLPAGAANTDRHASRRRGNGIAQATSATFFACGIAALMVLSGCVHSRTRADSCELAPLQDLAFAELDGHYNDLTRAPKTAELVGTWKLVARIWRAEGRERKMIAEKGVFSDPSLGNTYETLTFSDHESATRKLGVQFDRRVPGGQLQPDPSEQTWPFGSGGFSGDLEVPDSVVEKSGDVISGYSDSTGRRGDLRMLRAADFLVLGDHEAHQYQVYQRAECGSAVTNPSR